MRQADAGRRVGVLRQPGAVERVRTGGTPDVGVADLGERGVDRLLRGTAGCGDRRWAPPRACRRATRDLLLLRRGQRGVLALVVGDLRLQVLLLRGDLVVRLLRRGLRASALACAFFAAAAACDDLGDLLVGVPGDRVERAHLVDELVGRVAGQQHVEPGERRWRRRCRPSGPAAGSGRPAPSSCAWASAAAWSAVATAACCWSSWTSGLVDLLGDDLQLVAGVGDELGGLLRPLVAGRRGGGAREDGEGQGGGGTDEQAGAEPTGATGRERRAGESGGASGACFSTA